MHHTLPAYIEHHQTRGTFCHSLAGSLPYCTNTSQDQPPRHTRALKGGQPAASNQPNPRAMRTNSRVKSLPGAVHRLGQAASVCATQGRRVLVTGGGCYDAAAANTSTHKQTPVACRQMHGGDHTVGIRPSTATPCCCIWCWCSLRTRSCSWTRTGHGTRANQILQADGINILLLPTKRECCCCCRTEQTFSAVAAEKELDMSNRCLERMLHAARWRAPCCPTHTSRPATMVTDLGHSTSNTGNWLPETAAALKVLLWRCCRGRQPQWCWRWRWSPQCRCLLARRPPRKAPCGSHWAAAAHTLVPRMRP